MDESFLYQQIAETLRQEILAGTHKPGDKLPSVRKMTEFWNCTPGTVQRAYKILAKQGLIESRPGQGTKVSAQPDMKKIKPLRRAILFNRTENFLLESLSAGYSQYEIELAMRMALDHWRSVENISFTGSENSIRYSGSNDIVLAWIAAHFSDIMPNFQLSLKFGGSLSGLIALAEGTTDLAGCHLWDEENQDYNISYIERILPGKSVCLMTLAQRNLGIIVSPGNPLKIHTLKDLTKANLTFANRQEGSGTRVWLDSRLRDLSIPFGDIHGYSNVKMTHTDVARSIASGFANAGIGLKAAASAFDLDFIPLTSEHFELVFLANTLEKEGVKEFLEWLNSEAGRKSVSAFEGYDTKKTGQIRWVNP